MYILFDIGGTQMRLAVSSNLKTFGQPVIVKTPRNFSAGVKLFNQTALKLSRGQKIKGVAGGIAGVFDKQKTKLLNSPNLKGWVNKPLKQSIQKTFKSPVLIENDADMAGLGEAVYGAGKGDSIVAYLTISTGIGGTRIVDRKIDQNSMGFEPGHQVIEVAGKLAELEKAIGGNKIKSRYGKSAGEINDRKIWHDINRALAAGLNNVLVFWSPDVIVLGGGMMKNKQMKISDVQLHLKKINSIFPKIPPIKKAQLKDLGGLYGTLHYLKQQR